MRSRFAVTLVIAFALVPLWSGEARSADPVQARVLFDNGNRIVLD